MGKRESQLTRSAPESRATRRDRPEAPDTRSAEQIRDDIRRTRGRLDWSVEELENRLSPGRVADEAWERMKANRPTARVAEEVLRDHPLPIAVIGLGLGWLGLENAVGFRSSLGRGDHGDHGDGERSRVSGRARHAMDSAAGAASGAAGTVKGAADSVKGAADSVKGAAGSVKQRARQTGDRFSSGIHRAEDRFERARGTMGERARRTRDGLQGVIRRNPLALSVATFGAGVGAALLLPHTRAEDEWLGEASDTLKKEGARAGKEAMHEAREAGGEAAQAASDSARPETTPSSPDAEPSSPDGEPSSRDGEPSSRDGEPSSRDGEGRHGGGVEEIRPVHTGAQEPRTDF